MSEQEQKKDNWDKFEIVSNFLGAVVLVFIPIVIGYGADRISQSIQRGQLIQSLTDQLAAINTKRDIALIALNTAIPEKEKCTILWTWGCEKDLVDLSTRGYRVPSGQLEIWLKD